MKKIMSPMVKSLLFAILSSANMAYGQTNMAWIPPGTFLMGSPLTELTRIDDENQHLVTLTKGFYMAKFEVTQGQYQSVMGSNPSRYTPENGYTADPDLIDDVLVANLQSGIENSLDAKLDAALSVLSDTNTANDQAAVNSLNAFINAVNAQRGKKISNAVADGLIAAAQAILAEL